MQVHSGNFQLNSGWSEPHPVALDSPQTLILVFGAKAFEKYEAGEVVPSAAMAKVLTLAMRQPGLFQRTSPDRASAEELRRVAAESSVAAIFSNIYGATAPAG